MKIKVGADLSPAQAEVDKFQKAAGAAGAAAGDAIAKGVEAGATRGAQSLKQIEAAAQRAAKAAERALLVEKVQQAVGALGALKGVWDGLAVSALGYSEEAAKAISATVDMGAKGAQLGSIFGPLGGIIGGVGGAIASTVGQMRELEQQAPETYAAVQQLLGVKPGAGWLDTLFGGPVAEGAKLGLEKVADAAKASEGTWYDFSAAGAVAETMLGFVGQSALSSKENIDALKTSLDEAAASAALNAAYLSGDYGPQRKEKPAKKAPSAKASPKSDSTQEDLDLIGAQQREVAEAAEALSWERFQRDTERLLATEELVQRGAESDLAFAQQVHDTKRRLAEEAEAREIAALEAMQARYLDTGRMIGDAFRSAFVDIGGRAAATFFDQLEAGQVRLSDIGKGAQREAADFLKQTGSKLIGQGLFDEFKGASMSLLGNVAQGLPLMALGGLEIGGGLAMGGTGAFLGRRAGEVNGLGDRSGGQPIDAGSTSASTSGGSLGGTAGTREISPANVWLAPGGMVVFAGDARGMAQYGRFNRSAEASAGRSSAPRVTR